jgi:hypothetical protein
VPKQKPEPLEGEIIEAETVEGEKRKGQANGKVTRARPGQLSPIEEAWCVAYLRQPTALDAYLEVTAERDENGRVIRPTGDELVNVQHAASRIMHLQRVRDRVYELRQERALRVIDQQVTFSGYSQEDALREAHAALDVATNKQDPKAMVLAVALKAKIAGLIVDKAESGLPGSFRDVDLKRLKDKREALEEERRLRVVGGGKG